MHFVWDMQRARKKALGDDIILQLHQAGVDAGKLWIINNKYDLAGGIFLNKDKNIKLNNQITCNNFYFISGIYPNTDKRESWTNMWKKGINQTFGSILLSLSTITFYLRLSLPKVNTQLIECIWKLFQINNV